MTDSKRVLLLLRPSPARERLSEVLVAQGFTVTAQSSTFRAVSSLARTPCDVVVIGLDDLLEEELEVVRVVREEAPGTFVVLTFTPINRRKGQAALEMGADCYVLEPLKAEEVASALRHLQVLPTARGGDEPLSAAEPLQPEEVDFITSSLAAEAPSAETPPEDKPPESEAATGTSDARAADTFAAPAHSNGFHKDEQLQHDVAPPPATKTAASVRTDVPHDRLASLRKLGASVAHEINNPLTTLSGWIQLLLKKANGNHDLRRTLINMKEEADRIADVVRELSAISEPDLAGRGPTDINALAEAVIDTFLHANGKQQVQVKKIFTGEPPCVKADVKLLVGAVCDLLNSKYLDLGNSGSLVFTTTIGPDWVELHVYEPGSQVDLEPLGRALNSVNLGDGETIGADLSLARCQQIIASHGGVFTAECDPREGLSFQLRLPKMD